MITLIKLRYFVDVADLHSFTKAARKNHVAQTSVSQQIKELEELYQVKLIDRDQTPIQLTTPGQLMYEEAVNVLEDVASLNRSMRQFNVKQIKTAYSSNHELRILNQLFGQLAVWRGQLEVRQEDMAKLAEDLRNGQINLAISFDSAFAEATDIITLPVSEGTYLAGMRVDHPLAKYDEITLNQLCQYSLVMLSPQNIGNFFDIMLKRSRMAGEKPKVEALADNVESETFMIEQKNLIGFFPEDYPLNEWQDKLKLVKILDSPHIYKVVLAYRKHGKVASHQGLLTNLATVIAHRKNQ